MIAEQYPWPTVDGYRHRLHHMIAGLGRAGPVEVLALDRRPGGATSLGAAAEPEVWPKGVEAVGAVPTGAPAGPRDWLPTWVRGDMPRRVLTTDWSALIDTVAGRLDPRSAEPVDLVWFSHVDTWWALRDIPHAAATIVDFDNLENLALRLRRRTGRPDTVAETGRWAVSRGFDLVDERRWDRLQRACGAAVDRVVVCSDLDRVRSGCDNAVVVGNGASAPPRVMTDRTSLRGRVPTMLFVGALDYEPNGDAMRWFLSEILPLIRAREPRARVVVVGRGVEVLGDLVTAAGAEVLGPVDDLQPYLDAADVSVVPIRVGAGTRLKVVEALANRLPVVTTTVGCEGIDVTDRSSALIADDARTFADRCLALLREPALRQQLADAGADLFASRYEWGAIEDGLADLARQVVSRG